MARFRQLKLQVLAALGSPEWEEELESLLALGEMGVGPRQLADTAKETVMCQIGSDHTK